MLKVVPVISEGCIVVTAEVPNPFFHCLNIIHRTRIFIGDAIIVLILIVIVPVAVAAYLVLAAQMTWYGGTPEKVTF